MSIDAGHDHLDTAYRAALRRELIDTVAERRVKRGPSRLKIVATTMVSAGVVVGGGAVAYSALSSSPVTDQSVARCYSSAKYVSGNDFPGTTVAEADSTSGPAKVTSAVEACAAVWRAGILRPGVDGTSKQPPSQATYPVPALFACVMPNGQAAVFPGSGLSCTNLGLPAAATGS